LILKQNINKETKITKAPIETVKNAYLRYCEEEIETMRGREITE
jgi:hypothetical protein